MEEEIELVPSGNFTLQCTEEALGPQRDSLYIVIPVIVIYVIIFVTGTIGNISTCVVISRNKSMHTATNYYLFSLAISDLLLLLTGLPQEIYLIWSRYPYIFGSTFCFLRGLFAETSTNATVLTITAFTVERYLAICHPFLSHTMSKLSRAVKFILVIWLLAISLAIPQALQFGIVKGADDCEMCMIVNQLFNHLFEVSTFLFFVAPMSLITVLYILIGARLKSSRMMKKRSANARIQSKSSRKVLKMLVAVVVAFFFCWAPFHAQRLYTIYATNEGPFHLKIYEIVTYISGVLFYMSATVNPILYNIMSIKFREAFMETFAKCCGLSHLQHKRPQRSYSVLSRSNIRGPDSGDSAVHTHTTVTQKSSIDSFNGINLSGRRYKTAVGRRDQEIEEEQLEDLDRERELILLEIESTATPGDAPKTILCKKNFNRQSKRRSKFWRYFRGFAKKTLDTGKLQPVIRDVQSYSPCDISNSSLKDVETGAIEDELSAYMEKVHRENYS
ncbi:pyrokinin-1 receptor-like isoform X2 [Aethina tumida]|uniref:pyrokinin-1 receptor-like isoform X2 n=1 Tax=Aethina tumida TaxID=116153 RepID=UPI0021497825|nr:pyrokinin-1 receptor-like isoform X2 [Aethina tumida]